MNKFSKDFSNKTVKVPKSFWIDFRKILEDRDYNDYTCCVISSDSMLDNYPEDIRTQALKQWNKWYKPDGVRNGAWLHIQNNEIIRKDETLVQELRKLMINARRLRETSPSCYSS